jgi:glycosyltransferase involved in cell wall biosynthesis
LLSHRSPRDRLPVAGHPNVTFSRQRGPLKVVWMQLFLPGWLRGAGLEVCHFTNHTAPLAAPGPMVVTIHDLAVYRRPLGATLWQWASLRPFLRLVARRADAIIAVSHTMREEIIGRLGIAPERVHVVYEAAAPSFRRYEERGVLDAVAQRYDLAPGFLLFVGTVQPRKNLVRVVEALAALHQAGLRRHLVIAGRLGWKYRPLLARIEALDLGDWVRFAGYVPEEDLPALYNLAGALLFPSLYEGFGLPVLEAMACGTPVVTARGTATAEIAGAAALGVDPRRSVEIAAAAAALLRDSALRDQLAGAGLARAAEFSWARAAGETLAVYEAAREAARRSGWKAPARSAVGPRGVGGGETAGREREGGRLAGWDG